MKTIAILSQKGGAGKTTLAVNLAVAAEHAKKKSVIIDIDGQASATDWGDSRASDSPVVVSAQPVRLKKLLDAAEENGVDCVFIDTAAASESSALAAVRVADFVLIPCRPAIADLRAINNSIDIVRLVGCRAAVVLMAVPSRGSLAIEAKQAINSYDIEIAPVHLGYRMAFIHSFTAGQAAFEYEPNGKAKTEVMNLYKWLVKQVQ